MSESEFAGACAERVEKSRRVCVCAAAIGCRAGTARVLFFCERFLLHTKRNCSRTTMNFIFNSQWRTAFVRKNTKPRRAIHESPAKSHRPKTYHSKRSKKIPKIHKNFQFPLSLRPKNSSGLLLTYCFFPFFYIFASKQKRTPFGAFLSFLYSDVLSVCVISAPQSRHWKRENLPLSARCAPSQH